MPRNLFVLIDANALIHRSYHAIPHLTTQDGTPINAAYGFTMTLLSAIKELNPTYIAAAYDLPQPTFRHLEYKAYKATRHKADNELITQIPITQEILKALNIPIYSQPGLEADDIIGITAREIANQKIPVMIVTGDMDSLQLVNDLTKVFTLRRGLKDTIIYNPKTVRQRFGFGPEHIVDYKALRGDPSDNIPGVPGIGEKTATTLIQKYQSIEKLYDFLTKNPDTSEIKPRIKELLIKNKDSAFLSKHLATIVTDQPLPNFNIKNCVVSEYDPQEAVALFQKLEFKSLIPRLPQPQAAIQTNLFAKNIDPNNRTGTLLRALPTLLRAPTGKKYITIATIDQLKKLIPQLKSGFTFDTETSALDLYGHAAACPADNKKYIPTQLVGISISFQENEAFYLPLHHQKGTKHRAPTEPSRTGTLLRAPTNLPLTETIALLKPIFANPAIPKSGHNLKFDIQALALENIEVSGISFDTMIASYLLNPSASTSHKLDTLAFNLLGHHMIPITQLIGDKNEQISFAQTTIPDATIYSAEDADITFLLQKKLDDELKKKKLAEIFTQIEVPLIQVLASMEKNGITINKPYFTQFNKTITKEITQLIKDIHQEAGYEFNISSTQQLSEVLFNQLKLDRAKVRKTKTGLSTAASELDKMQNDHPIIPLIQQFRLLSKLKNTYVDTLPTLIKSDGRIHGSFNQTITATGRLSSSNPNLQNIPIKSDIGRSIRKAFIAPNNHQLIAADYSQIELRIMAHIAQEPTTIKAFAAGQDIHASTAALIYNVALDKVEPDMRNNAKTINFSIIYGAGPRNISAQLGISYNDAKQFIENYFNKFPLVKNYMEKAINYTRTHGYAKTLYGRTRHIPEISSRAPVLRAAAERIAINMPIQGSAADIMKLAMINIYNEIKHQHLNIKIISQVHDELIFEVPNDIINTATTLIKDKMENVCTLKVPLQVDIELGQNWGEMEKI